MRGKKWGEKNALHQNFGKNAQKNAENALNPENQKKMRKKCGKCRKMREKCGGKNSLYKKNALKRPKKSEIGPGAQKTPQNRKFQNWVILMFMESGQNLDLKHF